MATVAALAYQGGSKFPVASDGGNGFIVAENETLGTTGKGRRVLNLKAPDKAAAMTTVDGELVAAVGENRKLVIVPIDQVPEMNRGRGVRLRRLPHQQQVRCARIGGERQGRRHRPAAASRSTEHRARISLTG